MVLNYTLVGCPWLNGRQSYILSIFPFSVLKTLTGSRGEKSSKCHKTWFLLRLNENRTTEGLPRKGPNTVTFWVSNWYDMCSLCDRRLKAKGKAVCGLREKRGARAARFSRAWPETPFPFLPSPSPSTFFCSRSNFRRIIRLETLATQAIVS